MKIRIKSNTRLRNQAYDSAYTTKEGDLPNEICDLPAVPRVGDWLEWEDTGCSWPVSSVTWMVGTDRPPIVEVGPG